MYLVYPEEYREEIKANDCAVSSGLSCDRGRYQKRNYYTMELRKAAL
jgi:hypothetical protein